MILLTAISRPTKLFSFSNFHHYSVLYFNNIRSKLILPIIETTHAVTEPEILPEFSTVMRRKCLWSEINVLFTSPNFAEQQNLRR
jgi:hypothetical protein